MRREFYLASFVLLLACGAMAYGGQQDKMAGMQTQSSGETTSHEQELPVPDLLAEAKNTPAHAA